MRTRRAKAQVWTFAAGKWGNVSDGVQNDKHWEMPLSLGLPSLVSTQRLVQYSRSWRSTTIWAFGWVSSLCTVVERERTKVHLLHSFTSACKYCLKPNMHSLLFECARIDTAKGGCQFLAMRRAYSNDFFPCVECLLLKHDLGDHAVRVLSIRSPMVSTLPSLPAGILEWRTFLHMASAASGPHSELRKDSLDLAVSFFKNCRKSTQPTENRYSAHCDGSGLRCSRMASVLVKLGRGRNFTCPLSSTKGRNEVCTRTADILMITRLHSCTGSSLNMVFVTRPVKFLRSEDKRSQMWVHFLWICET